MDNSFFIYLEQLELMAFFSGYPLIYFTIRFLGETQKAKGTIIIKFVSLLPFAYALVGILYIGLQLKNSYPDYSIDNIKLTTQEPYLKIWGFLSVLFCIPFLCKKPVLSLLHSLVFFFLLVRDLFLHSFQSIDKTVIRNDMNIYSISLLINLSAFASIVLLYFLFTLIIRQQRL